MLIIFSDLLVCQEQPFHQPHLCSLTDQKSLFLTHTTCALLIRKGIFSDSRAQVGKATLLFFFFFFNFGRHCAKGIGALADLTPTIKCSYLKVPCVISLPQCIVQNYFFGVSNHKGAKKYNSIMDLEARRREPCSDAPSEHLYLFSACHVHLCLVWSRVTHSKVWYLSFPLKINSMICNFLTVKIWSWSC